jgi:cytochrome c oxidase subunit 3
MALAVLSAKQRRKQRLITYLSVTFILGAAFLTIKGFEYLEDFRKNLVFGASFPFHGAQGEHMRIFLFLYYLMTGVHALHLLIGLGLITVMIKKTKDNQFSSRYSTPIEVVGLYWHFVDIIWIFLYPLLYLVGKPVL